MGGWEDRSECGSAREDVVEEVEWVMYCTIDCYKFNWYDEQGYRKNDNLISPIEILASGLEESAEDNLCWMGSFNNEIDPVRKFQSHVKEYGTLHVSFIHMQPAHLPFSWDLNIYRPRREGNELLQGL